MILFQPPLAAFFVVASATFVFAANRWPSPWWHDEDDNAIESVIHSDFLRNLRSCCNLNHFCGYVASKLSPDLKTVSNYFEALMHRH